MRVASLETLGQLCSTRQGIAADEFRDISKPLEKSELLALLARMAAKEVASVADHSHAGLFSASLP